MRRRLRLLTSLTVGALTLTGLLGFAASGASAQTIEGPAQVTEQRLPADVDDFSFASLQADYRIDRDDEGRSTLASTETLVAEFPEIDQNHGIRRNIPTHYRGQPTGISVDSVTDGDGHERDYETETISDDSDAEYLSITIADDGYVHGDQTYVISHTQRHVVLFPDDAADQEFYWEVNGTGWAQPFGTVSATVHVAPDLVPALTGQTACYQGGSASGTACDTLDSSSDGDEWVIEVSARDLGPHEGLALAVAFADGTFVPRDDSFTANPFPAIALAAAIASLVAAALAVVARSTRWRNRPGRPTIIPEYLPPAGANLLHAGDVLGSRAASRALTAQFLQFAVRGNVRVLEGDGKNHYLLELRSRDGLDATERKVLDALFPARQPIGAIRDLKKKSTKLGTALQKVRSGARKRMITDGLREKKGGSLRRWLIAAAILFGILALVASIISFATEVAGAWPALFLVAGLAATIVTLAVTVEVCPLTARGAELRDYLKGVIVYISLAEADRLRVLQSPEGALRTAYRPDGAGPVATAPVQVLKLYERLLPIAVLTGEEKQWSKVLGDYYDTTHEQPDWYVGNSPFTAAYFATGVASFATSTASAWSGSAASSSRSGSGGGGSVGGGGGGGGGGGV
ncbi:DUF2207 domain-containing protein [Cryobacterium sp.]|jgi:uncharacterized membrane protein YgcG|uniref:DUF2207 domain-containing protein n=1 Tax=Cryobacterium sp. TaxID=1926290 RepID=UPI0026153D22|nr:DUF2207 domain-containing protein [Cryobacterium sp.]MCU1447357.1 hypothetical protein [Cryobacterium sp.]